MKIMNLHVFGKLCIPTSSTLYPINFAFIVNSAPINGLFVFSLTFRSNLLLINLAPLDISLNGISKRNLKIKLYTIKKYKNRIII